MADRPAFPHAALRVRFRLWDGQDRYALRRLNADARVMRYFPAPLSARASDALLERFVDHQERFGFGVWPVEVRRGTAPFGAAQSGGASLAESRKEGEGWTFLGFVGLAWVGFSAPFTPAVEIGWRLFPACWGHGYAVESARACLEFAFLSLRLPEVVAFTVPANKASLRVMARLDMSRDPTADFEHPGLPPGHFLRRHVVYRMPADRFFRGARGFHQP